MPDARIPEARTIRRWKPLRWVFVSLLAILTILIITIYFLPNIVSSGRFRSLLEVNASQTLQRPVHIGGLRWTWSDGISVRSFRIDDDPTFSREPLFEIKTIALKINLSELFRRRLNAAFSIEGLNLRFIRNEDGVTNVGTLLSAFGKGVPKEPKPTKTLDEWRKFSISLPFEVQARATLRDMFIRIEDRSRGRTLTLGKAFLSAEINSLEQKSLSVRTASDINLDGTSLPPFRLDANVRNVFTPKGELSLSDASVMADGNLPGMTIEVKCDLRTPEIRNKVQIELPKLMKIVKPFLPPRLSDIDIGGVLGFVMSGSGDPMKNLRFTLAFTGQDLGMTGGPFKKRSVGPLRFRVTNEGEVDLNRGKVTIEKGDFRFLERSVISWHGSIERIDGGAAADITVSPLSVDLGEVYRTAKPFLPEDVGLDLHGLSRAHGLTIGTIKLAGPVPRGLFTILLNDLVLRLPTANLKQKEMSVSSGESSLSVNNLRVVLKDLFPSQATAAMTVHIDDLRVKGPKEVPREVIVKGIDVPSFEISASDIQREKEALFGVAGRITLREVQSLGVLSVPETAEIRDLKESLSAEVFLRPAKSVEVDVQEFKADSPSVSVRDGTSVSKKAPLSISTTMSMVLRKGVEYEADIKKLKSDISMGKMLKASMDLTAERWGFGGLRTEGSLSADLSQVMGYLPQERVKNLKLSGSADVRWSFAGRLPRKEEMEEIKEPQKVLAVLRDRDIVRDLDLDAGLKALSVGLTTGEGKRVVVNEISTSKPLRVVMEKGLKKMDFSGAVSASTKEIPYLENLKEPLRVALDVSGVEADLNTSKVTIEKGDFRFLERSVISWHGSIEKTDAGAVADVTIGPISIDLDEVYRTAKPFLPEDVGLDLHGLSPAHALSIGGIRLSGPIPKGDFTILLNDLTLRIPMANLKQKETSVSSGKSSLSISNLKVILKDLFPSQATAAMVLHMDGLQVRGPKEVPREVLVKGIDVPSLEISASDIRREKDALFGVAGHITLREVQSLSTLSVPGTVEIRDLKESLSAEVFLRPAKSVDVDVQEFKVDSPSVSVRNRGSVSRETPFSFSTTMSMVLRKGMDYEADIKKLKSDISMGKMLKVNMALMAERWGFEGLHTEGSVSADLSQVMSYIPQEMVKNLKLSGSADMRWRFAGRLPGKEELEGIKEPEKALALLSDKDVIRSLNLTAGLKALSVGLTTAEGKRVVVNEISTSSPLRVVMEKGPKKMDFSGAVSASIKEIPYLENLKEPLRVALDVSGSGEVLKTFIITESLRVSPLNLKQEARVLVSGLDKLVSRSQNRPFAELLEFISGKAKFSLDLENTDASFAKKDIAVVGKVAIGADIDLLPRREIDLRGRMQIPGLDLTYGKMVDVKNLRSSISVAKRYRLFTKEEASFPPPPSPYLSAQVLKPATEAPHRAGTEGPVVGRLMSDMRAEGGDRRTFSAESVHVGLRPLPIDLTHTVLDFSLEEGLPSIDFFQADVMGGTVRGSLSLKQRDGVFFADFRSAFSGLNAQRLIPGSLSDLRDEEAEVSGRLSIGLPLSTSMDRLLEDVEFGLEISRVGSRALERMLYALDPYENNESIVQQRKLLRMGSVKWVSASVKDGMLSASGEVEAKGVKLELPRLERLNVASLPGLGGYEKRLAVVGPAIKVLNLLSANTVVIEKDGRLRFLHQP